MWTSNSNNGYIYKITDISNINLGAGTATLTLLDVSSGSLDASGGFNAKIGTLNTTAGRPPT
jgi:hypothetical protein